MRVTHIYNRVQVIGQIWMGGTAAYDYDLTSHDLQLAMDEDLGDFTRESVQCWLDSHAGDFARIDDFRYDFTFFDHPDHLYVDKVGEWESEESELTYNDCMYGNEDY